MACRLFDAKPRPEPMLTSCQLNTLRPRQNGRHFADDIFKYIFLNENVWIPIKSSLKSVPKGRINNIPALVPIMAWRRPGDKPLSEPLMVSLLTHICVTRPQWVKLRNKLPWNLNEDKSNFFKNTFESVACEMSTICSDVRAGGCTVDVVLCWWWLWFTGYATSLHCQRRWPTEKAGHLVIMNNMYTYKHICVCV